MSVSARNTATAEQIEARLRDFRKTGFEQQAMPHIIYPPHVHNCPWPNCNYAIAGIDFRLEHMGDDELYRRLMTAWWNGAGLVGACPGCGNLVLFSMQAKSCVHDPDEHGGLVLPENWHEVAFIVS